MSKDIKQPTPDGETASAEEAAFFDADEPVALFREWLGEAEKSEPQDANAVALATVDENGFPDVRMVLLKGVEDGAFVFYTNLGSVKARELAHSPKAAMAFHWKSLDRQVRVRGRVEPVSEEQADAYFASRHRTSQIGAWASKQSQPLESRFALERAVAKFAAKFGLGKIPRPPHWSGFRIVPFSIEFWEQKPFRLHDRLVFRRDGEDAPWTRTRLYP